MNLGRVWFPRAVKRKIKGWNLKTAVELVVVETFVQYVKEQIAKRQHDGVITIEISTEEHDIYGGCAYQREGNAYLVTDVWADILDRSPALR